MSAPDLPRFKLTSITGCAQSPGSKLTSTGWYILDTWDLHRVVSSFPVPDSKAANMSAAKRLEMAQQRLAELDQWHTEAMRDAC